jgi:hypothetical protein
MPSVLDFVTLAIKAELMRQERRQTQERSINLTIQDLAPSFSSFCGI